MKTNKRRLFASIAALSLSLGFFAFGKQKNDTLIETKADNITGSTTIYFRPSNNWMNDGAKFSAYFKGDGEQFKWLEKVDNSFNLYKVTGIPGKNFNIVIFVRHDGSASTPLWSNKWNQTSDLYGYTSAGKLYQHPEGVWDWANDDHWQSYNDYVTRTPTTEGINSSKMRIWLNRVNHYAGDSYEYLLRVGTTRYAPTGYEKALHWNNNEGGLFFPYYDVNINDFVGKQVGLTVRNSYNGNLEVDIPAQTFVEGDNSKVIEPVYNNGWSYKKDVLRGRIHNTFVAKVLEGYLTCSASVSNGYGAFSILDQNIIKRSGVDEMNIENNLDQATLVDFANVSNYPSGNRTVTIDAWTKYQALQMYYENAQSSKMSLQLVNRTTDSVLTISLVIAILGISALAFYIVYRKKIHV